MQARRQRGVVLAVLLLCGCAAEEDTGLAERLIGPPQPPAEQAALLSGGPDEYLDTRRPDRIEAGLVESPELFSESAMALWDGKPTLKGLWVAHPDAPMALRVRMTNPRTGTQIDGALLPGTPMAGRELLISAEAADALGLRPQVPGEIRLVAVERQVARAPEPDRYADALPVGEAAEPEPAMVEGEPVPMAGDLQDLPIALQPAAAPAPAVVEAAPAPAAPVPEQPAPPAVVAEAARTEQTASPPAPAPVEPPAAVADVPYRPGSPPEAPAAPSIVTDAGPEAADVTAAIADGKSYIQAGLFAEREQAADLVRALMRLGIPARNLTTTEGGASVSRVVAGPFATRQARAQALSQIRGLGARDAQPTSG